MNVCEIILTGFKDMEIMLCEENITREFLAGNFSNASKYGIDIDELEDCDGDENIIMQMLPCIKVDGKDAYFSTISEYREFLKKNDHQFKIVESFEGYLY